jgi:hypothetical protein
MTMLLERGWRRGLWNSAGTDLVVDAPAARATI